MKFHTLAVAAFAAFTSAAPRPRAAKSAKSDPDASSSTNTTSIASMKMMTDAPDGVKKGLAYNDVGVTNILAVPGSGSWSYNWGPTLDNPVQQGIPMCWGGVQNCNHGGIHQRLDRGNAPWVLGYNEPDFPTQDHGGSHMTPQQAYDSWGNDMFQFHDRGAKLVCPGISSYDTDNSMFTGFASGLTWLRQWAHWRGTPEEFRCDAQSLHWYGEEGRSGYDQARLFIDYLDYAHNVVNDIFRRDMPIWVTEFSPLPIGNVDVMADFLQEAIPWMNQQPWIHRYSPFMAEHMVTNGQINRAGWVFINTW